jgi:hypothetical protein
VLHLRERLDCRRNFGQDALQAWPARSRQHKYCDPEARQVLLILQVPIGGDEGIKFVLRPYEKLAVAQRGPALLVRGANIVRAQMLAQRGRNPVI